MISVLLVDDHPVVRKGLRSMLTAEPDLDVVGETGSGAHAVTLAASLRPDVVLMDLRMPDLDGVTATAQILTHRPETKVVVLDMLTQRAHAGIVRLQPCPAGDAPGELPLAKVIPVGVGGQLRTLQ